MRSRIAAVLTVGALLMGTGGAVAVGQSASTGGPLGGAASGQYRHGKTCTKKEHGKKVKVACPKPKPKPKHHGKSHKPKKKSKPKKKKPPAPPWSNCTLTQSGQLIVASCP
jgi:outer membrane biosynthesis protein TonB